MLIGIVGFAGSGKSTVGKIICEKYGYQLDSYASTLKDVAAIMFGWDRKLLEGDTAESRKWRESVDTFWENELDIPGFTPRYAIQHVGTNAIRYNFCMDFWVLSLKRRWILQGMPNIVIADCRFKNEIEFISKQNGIIIEVMRHDHPSWFEMMKDVNNGTPDEDIIKRVEEMKENKIIPHVSETSWIGSKIDYTLPNFTNITDLTKNIDHIMSSLSNKS